MTLLTDRASLFSRAAHQAVGQRRKYTHEHYHEHPANVAARVASVGGAPEMIAAAYLHDVVEDTHVTLTAIAEEFGATVAGYVFELTDQFVDPCHGNRGQRKFLERVRLSGISAQGQTIKLADLIDNTASIVEHDPRFSKVYIAEIADLLKVMRNGDGDLLDIADNQVRAYFKGGGYERQD